MRLRLYMKGFDTMFKWNDKYNLSIDCELFGYLQDMEENPNMTLDDLHFTVLAMIGAIAIYNPHAPQVYTTLDNILITMAQDMSFKASPKIRTGIMNGFNTLAEYEAIEMDQLFTGDKKQLVCIKPNKLGHQVADENGEIINYFQIGREELATILIGSNIPHHLMSKVWYLASRGKFTTFYSIYKQLFSFCPCIVFCNQLHLLFSQSVLLSKLSKHI